MKNDLITWMLLLLLAPGGLLPAASAKQDELAGEQEGDTPRAKPTLSLPEEGGPMPLSRAASSSVPSFKLPEYVITGRGEKKALYQRPELDLTVDTSGGISASMDETEAGKDQVPAQGQKEALSQSQYRTRPSYGQAKVSYGLQNTFFGELFFGQELEKFYYLVQGQHSFSDGGPLPSSCATLNQGGADRLYTEAGWRMSEDMVLEAEIGAHWRSRMLTSDPSPAPRMRRYLGYSNLVLDGAPAAGSAWRALLDRSTVQLGLSQSWVSLPGEGTAYSQNDLGLAADFEKDLFSRHSRTRLTGRIQVQGITQKDLSADKERRVVLGKADIGTRLKPWPGSRLNLNLGVDWISGAASALSEKTEGDMLVAFRASWDQRILSRLNLFARFTPGLDLPRMDDRTFQQDMVLPSLQVLPLKKAVDLSFGVEARLPHRLTLEIAGFAVQNDDHSLLEETPRKGLWSPVNVKGARILGVEFKQGWDIARGLAQSLRYRFQKGELPDLAGVCFTFLPEHEAELKLAFQGRPWAFEAGLLCRSERQARLDGSCPLRQEFDLSARLEYLGFEKTELYLEGKDLLAQGIFEFPLYAEPAPYAGAGMVYKF